MTRNYAVRLIVEGTGQAVCFVAILSLLFSAPGSSLSAASKDGQPTGGDARELVKQVTANEGRARRDPRNYYKFVQKEVTPEGSETTVQIETPQGEVGKLVSINNKPPSQSKCRTDANSLKRLVTDSNTQHRRLREQKEQTDRIEKLMAAVPDAFVFENHGQQQGTGWIEIKFYPNPQFQPQSRESYLLKGMRGTLWVDPESRRLAKIDGALFKDVKFGWGFLASLYQGGHFEMEQSKVPGGSWKQTLLQVDLDGSKLVFGQLHVHFKDLSQSFVRLPDTPTLAEAVSMLEQGPPACHESHGNGTTTQAQLP
ncbi:MAG: hypothetical protein EPN47_15145 [Acidobacteria bacterium]|nr:MAG: hypothetical protein EPN47_15145 [Acidobacteriota bacterium]